MSNLNIPGMFRPEGCRNVHFWCMTFKSKLNIHMTSNQNIPGIYDLNIAEIFIIGPEYSDQN